MSLKAPLASLTVLAMAALPLAAHGESAPPPGLAWAYAKAADTPLPVVSPGPHRIPGSKLTLTGAQLNDDHNPPDWNPEQHPPAPPVVAHQHKGGATPCAECHYFNGQGFIAIPNLTGLSAAYITEQVQAFRSGDRRSAEAGRPATQEMIEVAYRVSDRELAAAAAYFAALPRQPWVRVVEADTVPATRPNHYGWRDLVPKGAKEPIGGRIIEVSEDFGRMTLEDPHVGVVAYVPRGSVHRGAALVKSGPPGGLPCAACHGAGLHGVGETPPLAGRSPSYLARMLWDIKSGARKGAAVALMQPMAAGLNEAQITDLAAYLASLAP